jgi:hypothetical protein
MRSWGKDTFLCEVAACANARIFAGSGPASLGVDIRAGEASIRRTIAPGEASAHIGLVKAPFTGTVAARGMRVAQLAIAVPHHRRGFAMHASSLPDAWHRWRDSVDDAFKPHIADAEHPAPTSLADNPLRARLRPVRLVPLVVPGMALVLILCALGIGSLLR